MPCPVTRTGGSRLITRQSLLWLSEQRRVFDFVRRNRPRPEVRFPFRRRRNHQLGRRICRENWPSAESPASLDLLGESVTIEAEAVAARDQYLQMLDQLAQAGREVNVSVKLTQMGIDIDENLCQANMTRILDKARALKGFVRLDMESSEYTQKTLDFFTQRLFDNYRENCGVVIQLRSAAPKATSGISSGSRRE